ncbi:MAG: hypothetical protein H0W86_01270 [Armatimonadetes bacterium]|nr:hypothetical protein [Armatimonadota bacterium]
MPISIGAAVGAAALAVNIAATNQDPEQAPATPPATQNKNYFNPQMAIVFDFRGRFVDPDPSERKLDFSEIEFGFASDVDPYLKAEAYIAVAKVPERVSPSSAQE